jgi:glycosyltransferase-like protein
VTAGGRTPAVSLVTYSTRPRGGVVHTLALAEALHRLGHPVEVVALGDPQVGFFRRVDAPVRIIPAPPWAPTLEERVFASIAALTDGLGSVIDGSVLVHTQDCIAARAATRLRDDGAPVRVLRTVHHVDDFTTPALVECQRRSVLDPDHLLVVSEHWRHRLAEEFGVTAAVVTNGVDAPRFAVRPPTSTALRSRVGADDRALFLTVGGIEPRKGSRELVEALALLRDRSPAPVRTVVVGGHSFQDHRPYREAVLSRIAELGLDDDLVLVGTVDDDELPAWYHAADAFVFPSVSEGFGLVVLEAMAAGLPVVASDIPVFREYLRHEEDALLARAGDPESLAACMLRLVTDARLCDALVQAGARLPRRYTWERCARQHLERYAELCRAAV